MPGKILSPKEPVMQYLNNKQQQAEAEQQLEELLKEDIYDMVNVHKKYRISFGEMYGVVTISKRDKLELVEEIEYARKLQKDESLLIPYLGAMYGFNYLKKLDIDDKKFQSLRKSFGGLFLPKWLPHADYAYYAWNTGAYYKNGKITIPSSIDSLDNLVTCLGHEAAHGFGNDNDDLIEETFCDFFAKEYAAYFRDNHAGQYKSELKPVTEDVKMIGFISEIDALLGTGDLCAAEQRMISFRDGSYNQAHLFNEKRYSGDQEINEMAAALFSAYGARAIRIMPETKKQLNDAYNACLAGVEFSRVKI